MQDCLFCKIINGDVPSSKVYEDNEVIAFLDIMPTNPGHTLIVPKKHGKDIFEVDDELLGKLIITVKKIAKAIMQATNASGFNLILNTGETAGQVIPHFHFHIIPRHAGDGHEHWKGKEYAEGEMQAIAEKIKNLL